MGVDRGQEGLNSRGGRRSRRALGVNVPEQLQRRQQRAFVVVPFTEAIMRHDAAGQTVRVDRAIRGSEWAMTPRSHRTARFAPVSPARRAHACRFLTLSSKTDTLLSGFPVIMIV